MQAKLDEETERLMQLRQNLEQEWAGRALAGEARHQARDVQRRIIDDARAGLPPAFSGVGQNLAAAAMLLRAMPEPSTTEGRRIQLSPPIRVRRTQVTSRPATDRWQGDKGRSPAPVKTRDCWR